MRIDPKYFNAFILIVALLAAALIAFFAYWTDSGGKRYFKEQVTSSDSLRHEYWPESLSGDSLRISDFSGRYVLVDFWSTWSIYGNERHEALAELVRSYPDRLRIMAAAVRDQDEDIREYRDRHGYPFAWVNGGEHFSEYKVPGIPTMLLYGPGGEVRSVFVGYRGSEQIDSLSRVIGDGE